MSRLTNNRCMADLMLIEIICRMAHPSSEWKSSLYEILRLFKSPTHKKLYASARLLYSHKSETERFLFDYFYTKYSDKRQIRLFDLTGFYFECRKESNEKARFGRSKEKRNDAKLISLTMLTDGRGF
jgi:hypothetical protein